MELVQAGYFSKTHGVKGHLLFRADLDFDEEALKALFVETATGKAPYFIQEIKMSANQFVILLEEINSVEAAKKMIGKSVFIDSSLVIEEEGGLDWEGFELIDKHKGSLGNILEVTDNGSQVLFVLNYQGKEVLLPFVEDFVESVDEENKKLFFNAPEGLIDLYLEESGSEEEEE